VPVQAPVAPSYKVRALSVNAATLMLGLPTPAWLTVGDIDSP
jgi:hypothetical protein